MLSFLVFVTGQPRPSPPTLYPFLPSSHSGPFFSMSCTLFSATAVSQPFAYQSFPHSFHRNGGCTPLSRAPRSHFDSRHPTLLFSCNYKLLISQLLSFDGLPCNGGVYPPSESCALNWRLQTVDCQLLRRGEMGTGARGAPVPVVGLYVKIKRAESGRPGVTSG